MCNCVDFLVSSLTDCWRRICDSWCISSFAIAPSEQVRLLNAAVNARSRYMQKRQRLIQVGGYVSPSGDEACATKIGTGLCFTKEHAEALGFIWNLSQRSSEASMLCHTPHDHCPDVSNIIVSGFTKRGQKEVNQDALLFIEDFASQAGTVFCGVFDGHGPNGHIIARHVVHALPKKLAACWQSRYRAFRPSLSGSDDSFNSTRKKFVSDGDLIGTWKVSIVEAFNLMDQELILNSLEDCFWSGTTAVTLIKQGCDLILGNLGDSRAILGSTAEDGSLIAKQLTIDMKPDLPREAERIRRCNGRIFELVYEPTVKRVWLPHLNSPGLAMTRALGDYCLKKYGLISEPEITHCRLTHGDKFVVLATDGVWNVLTNEEVVKTVASTPARASASKAVIDAAMDAWKSNCPSSKADDCAVVCLFFDSSQNDH
ncbi:hypothetical protein KP509_38G037200 [Ceratopteris richardii]|uniref:PPM-type phosphatase domain-containing protein n=1 Tax=Ceratopteris richardii TaxID=49495 RepID=A0A8T2Q3W1_CERRI|nr:hypothetical protein KP509_38G037200 [Ceratopteris richardii]